jgi:hypothetical protein
MGVYSDNPRQQLNTAWQVATAALDQWRKQVAGATSEAVEKLDPAVRAALEAARAAVTGNWGACQCPCATAHPLDKDVCEGSAILTRRVSGRDMSLCAPCAVAQGVDEMKR